MGIFQVASVGLPMAVKAPGLPCQTLAISLSLSLKPCQYFHTLHALFGKDKR